MTTFTPVTTPKPTLTKLIKKHGGWWDDDVARFPTPHDRDRFLKELSTIKKDD